VIHLGKLVLLRDSVLKEIRELIIPGLLLVGQAEVVRGRMECSKLLYLLRFFFQLLLTGDAFGKIKRNASSFRLRSSAS
jgi:hypothetical protein